MHRPLGFREGKFEACFRQLCIFYRCARGSRYPNSIFVFFSGALGAPDIQIPDLDFRFCLFRVLTGARRSDSGTWSFRNSRVRVLGVLLAFYSGGVFRCVPKPSFLVCGLRLVIVKYYIFCYCRLIRVFSRGSGSCCT